MYNIADRLERLPFGRPHYRLLMMGGLGFAFDAMDLAIVAFVLPVLTVLWSLDSVQVGILGSATYIGYFFGAFSAGTLGDLIGRRRVMMYALAIYCLATVVSALSTDWHTFFATRVIAGFGTGAESAIVVPFLIEFVASRYRGRFAGALAGFFSFGFVGAALLGNMIVPLDAGAWRYALLITALPIVMLLWWRRDLPESARWLETRGRHAEADAIVRKLEDEIEARHGRLPEVTAGASAPPKVGTGTFLGNLKALWSRPLRRVTAMAWIVWFAQTSCYYAFFTWIPSLLVKSGMTMTKSFGYSILIYLAQIPGYYSAAFLVDKIGRKAVIVSYMMLAGVSAFGLANASSNTEIAIAGALLSFFMNGTYSGLYVYTPELFPTELRATGHGVASAIGRIGAIASPIVVGYVYPIYGFAGVFGITTAVLFIGGLAVLVLGIATKGRVLEDITAAEVGHVGLSEAPVAPMVAQTSTRA
ncbi:MFS transporter [Methylobacterium oryzae]|uniref:MFS transporter n=1 Tax=Methylobacterium oryzae TaxID=334852 RepID=UPI001F303BC3|nr:MFS transporter [Methylobacterium oryzae]UIN36903.1 MFS transporter [Methylobacterium oryzae]